MTAPVTIVEVGPRDGLQSITPLVPTEKKIELACRLAEAGLRRIEIGSAVNPRLLPQMADVFEVHAALRGRHPEVRLSVLVPNLKGAERALARSVEEIVYVLSVSESHNRSNVRRSVEDSLEEFKAIAGRVDSAARLRVDVSTAFHCPFEGPLPPAATMRVVERLLDVRRDIEVCLCDTTGRAGPWHVGDLFHRCREAFGECGWAFHGHDTYGLGVANVVQAYEAGVRTFDASIAGLGGCPYAPGATGNVATEDVAFLFENNGTATGIDLERLIDAAALAASIDGAQVGGRVRSVGAARLRCGVALAHGAAS